MVDLDSITQSELEHALAAVEEIQPTRRLVAAIAYGNGVSQSELADWFDVERKTVYNWLSRLSAEDLVESATDDPRSGRNRKLSDAQLQRLYETLHGPPAAVGLDAPAWTPKLVCAYLREEFDVGYSIPSCRRLLREAGLTYERSPRPASGATENEWSAAREVSAAASDRVGRWHPE